MTGQDAVFPNSGVARGAKEGDTLRPQLERHPEDAKLARTLYADAQHGSATEQKTFWEHMNVGAGKAVADAHLPKGFSITGGEGKHVVKDAHKHVVYDEAKTAAQADRDSKIRAGEGPYAALLRQGMTYAEATTAAKDVLATTGKNGKGFKEGEAYKLGSDGKGDWHKTDRDVAGLERDLTKAERDLAKGDVDDTKPKGLDNATPEELATKLKILGNEREHEFQAQEKLKAQKKN